MYMFYFYTDPYERRALRSTSGLRRLDVKHNPTSQDTPHPSLNSVALWGVANYYPS